MGWVSPHPSHKKIWDVFLFIIPLARLDPFFGNAQADAETFVGRELYFFDFTDNQWQGKVLAKKLGFLAYQENQALNFGSSRAY
ncbi:hypothetical protein [Nostoc sp.]|uniref:hypothetical protein n=1 Tax=Nostoc sp. TaxID=1180 RepID=UPI002FF642AB